MISGKSPDIKYQQWMAATRLGWNNSRSREMKLLDSTIQAYDEGITAFYKNATSYEISRMYKGHFESLRYKERWYLTDMQVALEAWKKSKGGTWSNSDRNKNGAISQLDQLLKRELPKYGRSMLEPPDESFAANARTGILYFLSNSRTLGMPLDPVSLLSDAAFAGADLQHLASVQNSQTSSTLAAGMTSGSTSSSSFANEANNVGFLNEAYNAIVGWLKELMKTELVAGVVAGVTELISQLPKVLGVVFSSLLSELGNVIGIARNIKSAISAYSTYRHRQELEEGIASGHPKKIIESVHHQIKQSIKDAGKDILFSGLKIGLNIASAGAGVVLNALASVIMFIKKIYERIKKTAQLRTVLSEAAIKDDKWDDADVFQDWFLDAITKLPIISCYCLTMPMTGSYYGFLAAASTNDTSFSFSQLARNNQLFNDVKDKAFSYIQDSDLKITSANSMVAQSLLVAQGGTVSIGSLNDSQSQLKRFVQQIGKGLSIAAAENSGKNSRYGWW